MALNVSARIPDFSVPMTRADGTPTEVWFQYFQKLSLRTGDSPGVDVSQLQQDLNTVEGEVSDLDSLISAAPPINALVVTLIARIVMLERGESAVVSLPQTAIVGARVLPDPVSHAANATGYLPDPVAPPSTALKVTGAGSLETNTVLGSGPGSTTGTLTNAPVAGNPTKWIPINDAGTVRHIPAW